MFCREKTVALRRYQKRLQVVMVAYLVILVASSWTVRHNHLHGWSLYFLSVLPAVPIMFVIRVMGLYLQEETDEYLRLRTMRALLVATAALLATIVISDFLQAYAGLSGLPPFTSFVTFCLAFAMTQGVLQMRDSTADE